MLSESTRKTQYPDRTLYSVLLGVWLAALVSFEPYLIWVFARAGSVVWFGVGVVFALLTNLLWLYGLYHVLNGVAGLALSRQGVKRPRGPPPERARVAILYTTRNDLQERAVEACLRQSAPQCSVYVLDDSTLPEYTERVDRLASKYPELVVVRRGAQTGVGFKAGNVNHALRGPAAGCDFFAIIDADDGIPPDFVAALLPRFREGDDIAFVQGSFAPDPGQTNGFAYDLGPAIDAQWKLIVPCRERFGFLFFYGHGALLRRDVWERVGGFPEVVSEDIAFSSRVRALGFRGVLEPSVVSTEEYPPTYAQFLRRQIRWTRGTLEWLLTEWSRLARSPHISWWEALDAIVTANNLLVPVERLVLTFFALGLSVTMGSRQHLLISALSGWRVGPFWVPLAEPNKPPGLVVLTLVMAAAPTLGVALLLYRQPLRLIRTTAVSAAVHLSASCVLLFAVLGYLRDRRNVFVATGDAAASSSLPHRSLSWSTLMGLAIVAGSVVTLNPFFAGLGVALTLTNRMQRRPEAPSTRRWMWVPLCLFLAGATVAAIPRTLRTRIVSLSTENTAHPRPR
jgi:cellulose synthase/poly-beta-1,6-N-acetylglucosamine synthase-like glycosyltransferase